MNISVIASGSNGNCCHVEDRGTSILLDAGISMKEYEKRMELLEKDASTVKAILISHSHIDHTRGAGIISRKYKIPVLMTSETYAETAIGNARVKLFNSKIKIKGMEIVPVITSHDVFSCGFKIKDFGLFTDTGMITPGIKTAIPKLKTVLLEANYDYNMLMNGMYPAFLKKRIASTTGHMDNRDTCNFLQESGKHLDRVLLGHLSENNNSHDVLRETYETLVKHKFEYAICSRDKESGCWKV